MTVHAAFRRRALATPDAPALCAGGATISYRELESRAVALAGILVAEGVRRGDRVAVCLDRSIDLVVGLLAVLQAGAAYLPIDPEDPERRRGSMLADAGVELVLCAPTHADRFAGSPVRIVSPDHVPSASPVTTSVESGDTDLAYLMYTSGSTGRPKAVMVEHRNILNLVTAPNFVTIGPDDRVLQLAPVSFDAATFEIWGALLNGATLVLAPPGPSAFTNLRATLREHDVTLLWLTAALFHRQIDEDIETFKGLRAVLAGGDVLSVAHVARLIEAQPDVRVINGYGPTETTTFACCYPIPAMIAADRGIPIGRPLQEVTVHVVSPSLDPVADGADGELYIGGAGVSRGYWGRPSLTAERFVPDPFGDPGSRMYRSGDRAGRDADGVVSFRGRIDEQFKANGHRIEPGEIENALMAHPDIREAAVTARVNHQGQKRIVAYVVPASTVLPRRADLRRYAQERLPAYMVPAMFLFHDALPVTPSGKVDRNRLPEPDWTVKSNYV